MIVRAWMIVDGRGRRVSEDGALFLFTSREIAERHCEMASTERVVEVIIDTLIPVSEMKSARRLAERDRDAERWRALKLWYETRPFLGGFLWQQAEKWVEEQIAAEKAKETPPEPPKCPTCGSAMVESEHYWLCEPCRVSKRKKEAKT